MISIYGNGYHMLDGFTRISSSNRVDGCSITPIVGAHSNSKYFCFRFASRNVITALLPITYNVICILPVKKRINIEITFGAFSIA